MRTRTCSSLTTIFLMAVLSGLIATTPGCNSANDSGDDTEKAEESPTEQSQKKGKKEMAAKKGDEGMKAEKQAESSENGGETNAEKESEGSGKAIKEAEPRMTKAESGKKSNGKENAEMQDAIVRDRTNLDGCQYMLTLLDADSTQLMPMNLDKEYMEDGKEVRVAYREVDAMTTCMAGQPVRIEKIETR